MRQKINQNIHSYTREHPSIKFRRMFSSYTFILIPLSGAGEAALGALETSGDF